MHCEWVDNQLQTQFSIRMNAKGVNSEEKDEEDEGNNP